MGLEERAGDLWFFEELYTDVAQTFMVNQVLHKETSQDDNGNKLHELLILDTPRYGRLLTIDGVVQVTEEDEDRYHEPLVHCSMNSTLAPPKKALLIGCDGGTLREAVKYNSLEEIDVVDIDRKVIDLVEEFMPSIANGAFSDQRVKLTIADGALYVKEKLAESKKYDVIIIDSPDPIGPAKSLFRTCFYDDISKILSEEGVVIRQTGVMTLQPDEMPAHYRQMIEVFPHGDVQGFLTSVPTYYGGYFTLVAASHKKGIFKESLGKLEERFSQFPKEGLKWYSPDMHRASMTLPQDIVNAINQSEFGREVLIDLYNCDYEIISSPDRLKLFAKKMVDEIKMKPFGEPIVPDFGHGKSKTAGPSLVQLIETSAICSHYSTQWKYVALDVFTCADLTPEEVVAFSMKELGADRAEWQLIIRGKRVPKPDSEIARNITTRTGEETYKTEKLVYKLVQGQ